MCPPAVAPVVLFDVMPSARVRISCGDDREITGRALLDTCASANLLTESFAQQLNAPRTRCSLTIGAVNELSTVAEFCTQLTVKSLHTEFSKQLTFFIVPSITDAAPSETIPRSDLNIPRNLKLADPEFHKPAEIDLLLGAGPTLSLFCTGQIKLSPGDDLILQKTKLGWILGGGARTLKVRKPSRCMLSSMEFDFERFWKLEEVVDPNAKWSSDEARCEELFRAHVHRGEDGRYVVALPFKEPGGKFGESRQIALKRLHSLQRKFQGDKQFELKYTEVMNDYLQSGHMSPSTSSSSEGFYLPHHAVVKESSNTTKLRVVFDASAKSSNRLSLNNNLLVGPTIQDDLFSILLRFRKHRYVVIADIEKMYRQFLIRPEDRNYQKVLWVNDGQVREYTLNTVTFGVAPAPFLAIRCLHQLAEDEGGAYPLAARILKRDMYVDNMLTGAGSRSEARDLCSQMTQMLKTAGMKMRQWASNDASVLENIDRRDLDIDFSFDENSSLKTLGIYWQARDDCFIYKVNKIPTNGRITKRIVLSEIAKIFDPIGLLGPIKLYAKRIMQELWQADLDWDESLPSDVYYKWRKFCNQLNSIRHVTFDRFVFVPSACESEFHGFCDASKDGYGACIYLRSRNPDGSCQVSLLCSRSRVAPLQTQTIPRLELCAMLLLANLYQQAVKSLDEKVDSVYLWSDSSIALNWVNTPPNQLKTFVANRVAAIQSKTGVKDWRHVRSEDNPADGLSRGQLPREFLNNPLWRHGPAWLRRDKRMWPRSDIPGIDALPEKRKAACLFVKPSTTELLGKFKNSSSVVKLVRAIAYCVRLTKKYESFDALSVHELDRAETALISVLQKSAFRDEYRRVADGKPLSSKDRLASLDPFIDERGIMRVGGRLCKAMISFKSRHPVILPKGDRVTDLIITYYHEKNHHSGVQNTLYAVRQKYWPIDGRNQVKRVIFACVVCFRAKPRLMDYKMGNLPSVRVTEALPFLNTGVDYCGPFYIKEKNYRNKAYIKCYVAVFVCMVTKAVHLEVAENMTTEAFLDVLKRFVSIRNSPAKIYSDNGKNFLGARNELRDLASLLASEELGRKVTRYTSVKGIEWHFIPPRAPNFGGLWEAAVKQFKHHLVRTASDKRFTYAQFSTFCREVEAILNSRPLTPMSDDINDLQALTAGHFLTGRSMNSLPERDYRDVPTNRLKAWEQISKLKQQFWSRWHREYLNTLMVRHKQRKDGPEIKTGMLALIKEDDIPSMQWSLGRIIKLIPGTDSRVRTVILATEKGPKTRPVTRLAILPFSKSDGNPKQ